MSGICGIWHEHAGSSGPIARSLTAMTHGLTLASERVEMRCSGPAGVGVCRGFETQQIYQDSQLLVACDCDLDNADDLARAISRENTGTASLLAALYQRFGEAFIEKLSGAFSIILWDSAKRILLAAVDGFGIHRLAYYHDGKSLLVASRIDAITRVGDIEVNINPGAIANVVNFTTILGPDTVFKEIQRLPAGAVLVSRDGGVRVRQYWDMRYIPDGPADEATLCREMDRIVEQAVAVNCANAPPDQVGSFLSGGTDSSTLLGMMSRWAKRPVQAFSIGFREQPFNEMEYAELAAKTFGARHHTYYVNAQDCFDALPHMIQYFDEPFGNSSAIATYFCGRLAAQHGVKVLLAGDGGDELFGGNERYRTDKIFHVYGDVPPVLRKQLIEPVLALVPGNGGPIGRVKRYVRRAKMDPMERFCSFQFLATHAAAEIFEDDFLEQLGDHSFLDIPARHYAMAPASHHLDRLLYVDVKITLADSDLPKVICMSEMSGIRARFPFLHRSVAEFSGRIPAHLKVKGFEKRYLFKRAFRNLLPAEIVRKKKHGFGIPVADWMRADTRMRELARDTLLSKRASERGYFKRAFIENLFRKHAVDSTSFYGDTLWTFLVLELWHRRVVDELARVSA